MVMNQALRDIILKYEPKYLSMHDVWIYDAAGDLTPYGKRDNVMITREVNGKLEVAHVDLRRADLFKSPYYYLQHNDIVYVTPNKVRAVSSANAGLWLSTISTALSAATIVVTVVKK